MFEFKRKPKFPEIKSKDDFLNPKAKLIVETYDLQIEEIFPNYRDLEAEVQANGGNINIDSGASQENMIKKLNCGAVISYELSTVKGIQIMDDGKVAILQRSAPTETYLAIGKYYERVANQLSKI